MTLRLRLVVALVLLLTVGLGVFGATTYALYSRSQYDQLDDQIRASVNLVSTELREKAGLGAGHYPTGPGGLGPGEPDQPDPPNDTTDTTDSTESPDIEAATSPGALPVVALPARLDSGGAGADTTGDQVVVPARLGGAASGAEQPSPPDESTAGGVGNGTFAVVPARLGGSDATHESTDDGAGNGSFAVVRARLGGSDVTHEDTDGGASDRPFAAFGACVGATVSAATAQAEGAKTVPAGHPVASASLGDEATVVAGGRSDGEAGPADEGSGLVTVVPARLPATATSAATAHAGGATTVRADHPVAAASLGDEATVVGGGRGDGEAGPADDGSGGSGGNGAFAVDPAWPGGSGVAREGVIGAAAGRARVGEGSVAVLGACVGGTASVATAAGFVAYGAEGREPPPPVVPAGTYAALYDGEGVQQSDILLAEGEDQPALPDDLLDQPAGHLSTVGSVDGDTRWRVLVDDDPVLGPGYTVVLAFPTSDLRSSLSRLIAIEAIAAAGLLVLVALGAWLILRRGLRPLERMASTAGSITAGDLDTRVEAGDERSEVGQLGLALNTMLGKLEVSFAEQEATEQRLRQFLADASHELRTPLTSIQGFAELFRLGAEHDQVDLAVTMRRIEEESARMKDLVDDLLTLARLDQTRPIERVDVDLAVLAADACSDAVAAEPGRPITLDAPEPVVVHGDRDLLRQAIANLVGNAQRHTPAGRPIEVAAAAVDSRATVSVRDHGPGLGEAALAHAFDRFWQADPSRSEEGAGLGLAIVAGIAAEHGGTATAANLPTDAGGGALFTLTLPR